LRAATLPLLLLRRFCVCWIRDWTGHWQRGHGARPSMRRRAQRAPCAPPRSPALPRHVIRALPAGPSVVRRLSCVPLHVDAIMIMTAAPSLPSPPHTHHLLACTTRRRLSPRSPTHRHARFTARTDPPQVVDHNVHCQAACHWRPTAGCAGPARSMVVCHAAPHPPSPLLPVITRPTPPAPNSAHQSGMTTTRWRPNATRFFSATTCCFKTALPFSK